MAETEGAYAKHLPGSGKDFHSNYTSKKPGGGLVKHPFEKSANVKKGESSPRKSSRPLKK